MILLLVLFFEMNIHQVSYYGDKFNNRKTANGEIFNKNEFTCAALKEYKFDTELKVTNLSNMKSVIVRVNDRGNFKKYNRTLDLSEGAFKKISQLKKGVLFCKIEKII
jgi:rare lipoprotein A